MERRLCLCIGCLREQGTYWDESRGKYLFVGHNKVIHSESEGVIPLESRDIRSPEQIIVSCPLSHGAVPDEE